MPRLPLPLLSFGALAVLAGVVTGAALHGVAPDPPREQRVDTPPAPSQRPGGDGPPMEFEGTEVSTTTAARRKPAPTTTTVGTQPTATQITSTTTTTREPSVTVPELPVSVPVSTSTTEVEIPTTVSPHETSGA